MKRYKKIVSGIMVLIFVLALLPSTIFGADPATPYAENTLIVKAVDKDGNPLAGATFNITQPPTNSGVIKYATGIDGMFTCVLQTGTYALDEILPPNGYSLQNKHKDFTINKNTPTTVEFQYDLVKPTNGKPSVTITKIDADTTKPLEGAIFTIYNKKDQIMGMIQTDSAGKASTKVDLEAGWYKITETQPPVGYLPNTIATDFEIKKEFKDLHTGQTIQTVELIFENKKGTGLELLKRDSLTKEPLEGAVFAIYDTKDNIIDEYITDKGGKIFTKILTPGWYKAVEVVAPCGYELDDIPKDFEIKPGETSKLIFENKKIQGLTVKKIDATTKEPIPNTHFRIYNESGNVIGSYTTDFNGMFNVKDIKAGTYKLEECRPALGYVADKALTTFKIEQNTNKILTICNEKATGLLITKINSITGDPLQGVEFELFDSSHKPLGKWTTDNNGRILLQDSSMTEGTYFLKEVKTLPGYNLDSSEKTLYLRKGVLEQLIVENVPKTGEVQVMKRAGADNMYDGTAAGEPLPNAYFGLFSIKTGKLVETIQTKANGWGISNRVPLGEYVLREIKAPLGWKLSDEEIKVVIKEENQVVKHEILNYPADVRFELNKTGPTRVRCNQYFSYVLNGIRNASTVKVDNFYVRDTLPQDVLRVTSVETGVYNIRKLYSLSVTTNKGRDFIAYDNLNTTQNRTLDLSAAALNLQDKEFVTSFKWNFSTVPTGFTQISDIKVNVLSLDNLRHNLYFVNKADVGGRYSGEWTVHNVTHGTSIENPVRRANVFPRTGY